MKTKPLAVVSSHRVLVLKDYYEYLSPNHLKAEDLSNYSSTKPKLMAPCKFKGFRLICIATDSDEGHIYRLYSEWL